MTISTSNLVAAATRPDSNCQLCPRLAEFRAESRARHPDWFNSPVESFGDPNARLLIVGLAPGMQGANRTGRPFTGDYAGDLLYATLLEYGFASGVYQARPDDGFTLVDSRISNAVRCVPPQNKPLPVEINTCRQFLSATIAAMPNVRAIVLLGRIAHESTLRALGLRLAAAPFVHGAVHSAGKYKLYDSYHCSRYNTNTGVLTTDMFRKVFATVQKDLGAAFGGIVTSLVNDIIMPIVGMLGGLDFSNYFVPLSKNVVATNLADAKKQGAVLAYGSFITLIVNFVIVAFVLFMVIRTMNQLKRKEAAAPAEPPKPSEEVVLLTEIRDLLKKS